MPEELLTDNGKQFTDRFGRESVEAAQAALDARVEEYKPRCRPSVELDGQVSVIERRRSGLR
ncbi:hypothetical protein ACFWJ5_03745 [Streptomyces qaidamensis]|uniref:hypothetical protein n=1 Tax=Streptomyces qaidamensis TaxID=1783515 RepID=UPI00366667CD